MKICNFSLHSRKNSPYLPQNELYSAINGKNSAYFTTAGYSINKKTSYIGENQNSIYKEKHIESGIQCVFQRSLKLKGYFYSGLTAIKSSIVSGVCLPSFPLKKSRLMVTSIQPRYFPFSSRTAMNF
jgi:hypothetical protein